MRVGLVLGGGAVVGMAYHAASLAAIEHDPGWDPRSADVIVGMSAGALVGALLRRGVPASDRAGVTVGAAARSSPPGVADALRDRPDLPALRLGSFVGRPRLPSLRLLGLWARRPWRFDPVAALATVVPDGSLDLAEHATAIDQLLGGAWPGEDLWICTCVSTTSAEPSSAGISGRRCRRPYVPHARFRDTSARSASAIGTTSTVVSGRPPTQMSSVAATSTGRSSSRPCLAGTSASSVWET
jgi:hypothetical protein